ncbi:hypothetical protein P4K96_29110 [Bacillus cereus]|uniref:hypothetical protein n=1 Tax=Paenibacillus melissococcoides TaxID=2912268 RepID=UPI002DD16478|nr:hypothetical protein [Bacillus cereus]
MKTETMRYLEISVGDRIVLKDEVVIGLIKVPSGTSGKIVYHRNQVEADIWFFDIGNYSNDPITNALHLNKQPFSRERMRGVVLEVPKTKFSVVYEWRRHDEILISEKKASSIPFFDPNEAVKYEANWYIDNKPGIEYKVGDIHEIVDEGFRRWVDSNLKYRKLKKQEIEDGYFPEGCELCLNDKSQEMFDQKRTELERAFSKATGLYAEFHGGLIFD